MQNGSVKGRELSVEEAEALVRPIDSIGFGIITGTPVALFRALGARGRPARSDRRGHDRSTSVLRGRWSYGLHGGTSLSLEHASLICLQSTAAVGGVLKSRIIGDMTAHSTVTSPRQLAGVIITEYGSADLRERTVRERAAALTAIAHPQFRDELTAAAELLGR